MAKPPFDTEGPLCIEKFNDVGKAARNRVGGGARVAPRDQIVGDRVGQQGRVGLGERLASRLANCSNFASRSLRAWAGRGTCVRQQRLECSGRTRRSPC